MQLRSFIFHSYEMSDGKIMPIKKKTNKIVLNVNVCVVAKKHLVNVLNMIVNKFQSLHLDTKCRIIRMNFIS